MKCFYSSPERPEIWQTSLRIWTYCKPLKYLKTTKTFLGKTWHWNHTYLEMFGKKAWREGGAPERRRVVARYQAALVPA
jgi:hypothetical protein